MALAILFLIILPKISIVKTIKDGKELIYEKLVF
jgi:hypothetical protein